LNQVYRQDLNWLVTDFTGRVDDVAHAIVVAADGVPLAVSEFVPAESVEQLAAITSGLSGLIAGVARITDAGKPTQALVEMDAGLLLIMSVSDGSTLAVLASLECDTDLVCYEMALLVEAVGEALTPAPRASHQALPSVGSRWTGS
jgi:hypothetical protein